MTVALGLALRINSAEHRDMAKAYQNFGCFILLSGGWMLTDSRIILMFADNIRMVAFISYCCFMLLPLPLLRYYYYLQPDLDRVRLMNWLYSANAAVFLIFVLLDVHYYLYFMSLAVHHLLTIVFVLSLFTQKLVNFIRRKEEFRLSLGFSLFYIFCVGAVVLFLIGFSHLYATLFGLGLLCLIASVFVKLLRYSISAIKGQLQNEKCQFEDP